MNPLHFAVVVGIKSYPGISDLQSALSDAEKFSQWLQTDGGVPPGNIKLIHIDQKFDDPIAAKPSRDDINMALKQVNASVEAKIKDALLDWEKTRLYFYVSGHGIAPTAGETALLLANASEGNWGENIACRSYLERYVDCQYFKEVLVFSDCCRNRLAADLGIPPFGPRKITRGRVEIFLGYATLLGDAAYEPTEGADPNQARSCFTQALLEGLGGAAPDPRTGEINTATLAAYIRERVIDITSDKRYRQIPEFPTDPGRPIILRPATAPVVAQHTITIVFPAGFSGTAELFYNGIGRPLGSWKVADGNWVVKLQNALYEVRPAGENDGSRFQNNGLFKINGGDRYVQL
jgi:hypothetical protein